MDLIRAGEKRCLDLNEMEELRNDAYINSKVAKQRMKKWHDQLISNKELRKGQRVLLYDSRLHIFPESSSQASSMPLPPHPEPPTGETTEPLFPQHHSASLRGTTSSLFFNRFCHIEDNVPLGWGELRKEVFVINAKLFW
ncbi:hypothetical protein AAG906_026113 [Vitis piasezkii]